MSTPELGASASVTSDQRRATSLDRRIPAIKSKPAIGGGPAKASQDAGGLLPGRVRVVGQAGTKADSGCSR